MRLFETPVVPLRDQIGRGRTVPLTAFAARRRALGLVNIGNLEEHAFNVKLIRYPWARLGTTIFRIRILFACSATFRRPRDRLGLRLLRRHKRERAVTRLLG